MIPAIPTADFLPIPEPEGEAVITAPAPRAAIINEEPENLELLDPEWMLEPPAEFIQTRNGTRRLVLTLSRRLLFLTLCPSAEAYPQNYYQAAVLLYLAANPRTRWNAPVKSDNDELLAPLHSRTEVLKDEIDGWMDRNLKDMEPKTMLAQARRLWIGHHRNQVIVPDNTGAKKKTQEEEDCLPASDSPTCSQEVAPSASNGLSTNAPCGTSTPVYTPISSPVA